MNDDVLASLTVKLVVHEGLVLHLAAVVHQLLVTAVHLHARVHTARPRQLRPKLPYIRHSYSIDQCSRAKT